MPVSRTTPDDQEPARVHRRGRRAAATLGVATVASLTLAGTALAGPPPANDQVQNATVIPALPAAISGTTVDATAGVDEPSPLVVSSGDDLVGLDRSVWYSFTSPLDGNVLLNACDSNFDNYVNVFTGSAQSLKLVKTRSNPYRACRGDRQTFAVKKGDQYFVRVATERAGSTAPQGGVFRLKLEAQSTPQNDAFASATVLPDNGIGAFDAPLAFSTVEFGEKLYSNDRGSVWFRLNAPTSRPYTVQVPALSTSTALEVFSTTGPTINALKRLGSDYASGDSAAKVNFTGLKGRSYVIRLSTTSQVPDKARLLVTTNSAAGAGLSVKPASNSISGLRRRGFQVTASCIGSCRAAIALYVSPKEAVRYKLVSGRKRPRNAIRIGRLTGVLPEGGTNVTVPVTPSIARRLRGVSRLHVIVESSVAGGKGKAARTVQLVK
ncbi:hypothetical protein [Patulibacter minatonensis]|uniref:hypothetical protein n=1 Tax=Patulibacter minatonensis TaxID=298163 RepID=UPI0004786B63|nr:hypothetical protein [Patulibacter minatonensis]